MFQYGYGGAQEARIRTIIVNDYRAANAQAELVPWPLPDLEEMVCWFGGVPALCSIDLMQGYRHEHLADEAQVLFDIALPSGLYTSTRVPEGMLSAIDLFQPTMAESGAAGDIPGEVQSAG